MKAALPFLAAVRKTIQAPPDFPEARLFAMHSAVYMSVSVYTLQRDGGHNVRHLLGASGFELINPCVQSLMNGSNSLNLNDNLLQMHLIAELVVLSEEAMTVDMIDEIVARQITSFSATLVHKIVKEPEPSRGVIPPGYPEEKTALSHIVAMWTKIFAYAACSGNDRYRCLTTEALNTCVISFLGQWSLTCDEDALGLFHASFLAFDYLLTL